MVPGTFLANLEKGQWSRIRRSIRFCVNQWCRDAKQVLAPSEWIHKFYCTGQPLPASHLHDKRFTPCHTIWRTNDGRNRDSVREDAWRCGLGEVVCAMSWRTFWNVPKKIKGVTTCHNLIVTLDVTHFVNSSSLMRNKWYDMARTMRLDKLCATKTAGLGTPYISHQCEACLRQMRSWTKFHVNLRFRLQSSYKYSKTFTTTFH